MHTSTTARTGALLILIAAQGCAPVDGDVEVDSTAQAITSGVACSTIPTPLPPLVCQGSSYASWYTFPSNEVNRACVKDSECVVQRFTVDVCGNQRATAITNTATNRTNFQRLALTSCTGFDASRCATRWNGLTTTTTTDSGRVLSNKLNSTDTPPTALCCDHACVAW